MGFFKLLAALFVTISLSMPAFAMDVGDLRQAGKAGENYKGYLVAIEQNNPELELFIAETNARRKKNYMRIAEKQEITLEKVELLAGEQLFEKKLAPGDKFLNADGEWITK